MTGLTWHDVLTLAPLIAPSLAAVVLVLSLALFRSHAMALSLALLGLGSATALLAVLAGQPPRALAPLLTMDHFALFFLGLIFAGSIVVAVFAHGYFRGRCTGCEEFYVLLLLATAGAGVLVCSTHFVSFFLGLEILSVSLYAMIAFGRAAPLSAEAGIKYLVPAAVSAAFLLFGMALVYSQTGTMQWSQLARPRADALGTQGLVFWAGVAMMLVGIGFKLALVPFHLWTADVYQGAPAPVSAFIATVSKGAVLALLLRLANAMDLQSDQAIALVLTLLAVMSMLAGNLLALLQRNVKRVLAYSSIAHLGYMLVALLAAGELARLAVGFYLVAYFVTMLGAFGVVSVLSTPSRDAQSLSDFRGLAARRPVLCAVFTAMLLSLAGIPLTAGFVGKFLILRAGAGASLWLLAIVLVAGSVMGLFYYLRIVAAMYASARAEHDLPADKPLPAAEPLAWAGAAVLGILTAVLILLGVYPSALVSMIQWTMQY